MRRFSDPELGPQLLGNLKKISTTFEFKFWIEILNFIFFRVLKLERKKIGGRPVKPELPNWGGVETKKVWLSSGQSLCLRIARPGYESRLGASPECGLRGGRSHCNTDDMMY